MEERPFRAASSGLRFAGFSPCGFKRAKLQTRSRIRSSSAIIRGERRARSHRQISSRFHSTLHPFLVRRYVSQRPSHRLAETGGTFSPVLDLHRTNVEFPECPHALGDPLQQLPDRGRRSHWTQAFRAFSFSPRPSLLFIPWSEISVAKRSDFLSIRQVKLLLGDDEQIPFMITGRLAEHKLAR